MNKPFVRTHIFNGQSRLILNQEINDSKIRHKLRIKQ